MNRLPPPPPPSSVTTPQVSEQDRVVSHILDSTLEPHHRNDPNVLRFINSYMGCRNAKQAAEAVGLTRESGVNLLQRPDIYGAVKALTDKATMKYGFDEYEVVQRMREISEYDPVDFMNPDGTYKENLMDIPPEARRAIKYFKVKNCYETDVNGIKQVVGKIIEIEVFDKIRANELIGREKEVFTEKKKVTHDIGRNMADMLLSSEKRAADRLSGMKDVTPPIVIPGKVVKP